jgi:hypothetical protein
MGRVEKFAALRFVSSQLDMGTDEGWDTGRGSGGPPGMRGGGGSSAEIAQDAASLLAMLSLYAELLARPDLSWEEHLEYATQMTLLTDESWRLVGRFLRHSRRKSDGERRLAVVPAADAGVSQGSSCDGPLDESGLPVRRGPMRERGSRLVMEGAAGWMAC